jgi:hypothetical protein
VVLTAAAVVVGAAVAEAGQQVAVRDVSAMPADKQAALASDEARRLAAPVAPKPTGTTAAVTLSLVAQQSLPPRSGGIMDTRQGPFPVSGFQVNNMWAGAVNGGWLLVYAGGLRDPSTGNVTGGGVWLFTEPLDPNTVPDEVADAGTLAASVSAGVGALTVVSVSGTTATLTDGPVTR